MNRPELSLVIPFYNDSGCPIPFIKDLKKELEGIDYELILIDDCSKDATPNELISLKEKKVKIILNKQNRNYGGAIMTGLNIAEGKILGFTCGDGEVTAKNIVDVYKKMGNQNVIKAIRKNRKDGLRRKIISKIFNLLCFLKFGLKLEDINGYPVYFKREIYNQIGPLKTDSLFNLDLYRKIIKRGYSIAGVPVFHEKRSEGASNMNFTRIGKMVIGFFRYQ
jgi:glycosyltransferase involved in cell wall biosynthesis